MEDSVAQLGAFVAATAPKPPPPPEYPGYEPVFKKHYPLFYKVCAPAADALGCLGASKSADCRMAQHARLL